MARTTNRGVFNASLLPDARPRWDLFSAGFGLQVVAVTALVVIPLLMPEKFQIAQHYWTTPVETPPIVAWKPQPPPPQPKPTIKEAAVKPVPKPDPVVAPPVEVPKPKVYNPVVAAPVVKKIEKKTVTPDVDVAKAFPTAAPTISMGSSAVPNIKKPREAVQTGGFGDVDGVKSNNNTNRNPNINVAGGFDMPKGPGEGNGTGGANGAKGVVASTGFGNGVAAGGNGGGSHGSVKTGGFDEQAVATPTAAKPKTVTPNTKGVEILFNPKPVYSDEGRAKKIEGDVRLQVLFSANGEIKVLRVVQGLGYGLDEQAETAARQIKFKPATQDGQPVDQTAIVHIVFALAN
ncbi:MAG: energy transducer TonB [Candidatus Acidiferrales bacterium]|jgi:TonB family protein